MSLLSQILGGLAGSALGGRNGARRGSGLSPVLMALLPVVLDMLSRRGRQGDGGGGGGLGELLGRLSQRGYGQQAASWVGTGSNEPLPPRAIDDVFGEDELQQMAQQAGISSDEARAGLSELLPDVVDHFTPGGTMPEGNTLADSVDDYLRRLS
ncbi:YidB family protein [Variovorax sp. J22G21]|uniref:YidB family protein n=1 Tax=Variovorax fucosicus TaxID=3053517 RepID=UPI002574BFC1|nr:MULTISPECIES: YidB family protein [unclassified Variovorax]MDM0040631.1 YidB family protein [Variovorax sp. J22R193]MDM0058749.1 YidB family protein [Variovorax sp. J22G47]MDM0062004.1 YidB family protein [Variovorax sp. J22G21]